MDQQIDTNKLLQIIGTKETELIVLREYISQLQQEIEKHKKTSQPLKTEAVD